MPHKNFYLSYTARTRDRDTQANRKSRFCLRSNVSAFEYKNNKKKKKRKNYLRECNFIYLSKKTAPLSEYHDIK